MHPDKNDTERRVAVLVDCDNTTPEILEHALRVVAPFGRVVVRRGYGNPSMLGNRWQETLVRLAFTPCLQYPYAAGKNTADIALALDALEALFDRRADTFCLVTSDSDFACVCRKLRERGASVHVVGEAKTPEALRNASDRFFEWQPAAAAAPAAPAAGGKAKPPAAVQPAKRRPESLIAAVNLLAASTAGGRIGLGALGQHLKLTVPGFSAKAHGHPRLLDMVQAYPELSVVRNDNGWWVGPRPDDRTAAASTSR